MDHPPPSDRILQDLYNISNERSEHSDVDALYRIFVENCYL